MMSCPVDRSSILLASYWAEISFGETCLRGLTWSPTWPTHMPFGSMWTENMDFDLVYFYLLSFTPLCTIPLWCTPQIDWIIPACCFLWCPSVLSLFFISSVLLSSSIHCLSLIYLSGLLSIQLVNLRPLCHHYPPPLPITPFFLPPLFSFTDSQLSLPLSFAPSPLHKDSHWWYWTFCPSHILLLILLLSMPRGAQLKPVCSVVLLSVCLHLDSLGSLIKTL